MIDNLSMVLPEKLRRILESRPHHALVPEARENPTLFTLLSRLAHRDLHGTLADDHVIKH
jgi:hypothetical protein